MFLPWQLSLNDSRGLESVPDHAGVLSQISLAPAHKHNGQIKVQQLLNKYVIFNTFAPKTDRIRHIHIMDVIKFNRKYLKKI